MEQIQKFMKRRKNIFLVFEKAENNPDDVKDFNQQYFGKENQNGSPLKRLNTGDDDEITMLSDLVFDTVTDLSSANNKSKISNEQKVQLLDS
jgi:hypothetical protein